MSIQISITVWTIICFVVLMLILDRLLFRPLLSFMDKRREKIDGAKTARETALREREEELTRRETERAEAKRRAMADAAAALEDKRVDYAHRKAEKKAENDRRIAELREELDRESCDILAKVQPRTDELISAIAVCVQAWGAQAGEGRTKT